MAFRSSVVTPYSSSAYNNSIPLTVPSGAASGDIAIAWIATTNNNAPSLTGWTQLTSPTYISSPKFALWWFWKRLTAADTGTYTFDIDNGSGGAGGWVGLWSGRLTSGSPFDFTTTSSNSATQPTAVTGTATAGSDLVYGVANYAGTNPLSVTQSGYTRQQSNADGDNLFTADDAAAGSKTAQMVATASTAWLSTFAALTAASGGGGETDGTLTGALATATSEAVIGTLAGDSGGGGGDTPDPLAAFSFDAATGNDDSGNGNTGTAAGTGITYGTGHTNGGLTSDGSNDTYLTIPRTNLEPASAITIMGWFISASSSQRSFSVALGKSRVNLSDTFAVYAVSSGTIGMEFSTAGDPTGIDITSTTDMRSDDTWHHLAATYDGTTVTLYVDGEVAGTPATTSGDLVYDTTINWSSLGADAWSSEGLNGSADDLRIYDTALTQDQIQSLMNTPVTAVTGNGHLSGALATATSASAEGEFEASSTVSGNSPAASSAAIAGSFTGSANGTFSGATATATSTAIEGSFTAAVNGVLIGALATAVSAAMPGILEAQATGTFAGALATAMAAATGGSFTADGNFAGAAATATSRAIAGTLAGHLAYSALIVSAVTGPALSRTATGAGIVTPPSVTGPNTRTTATGPGTSRTVTGPGI